MSAVEEWSCYLMCPHGTLAPVPTLSISRAVVGRGHVARRDRFRGLRGGAVARRRDLPAGAAGASRPFRGVLAHCPYFERARYDHASHRPPARDPGNLACCALCGATRVA